jgi:hypothetical protein
LIKLEVGQKKIKISSRKYEGDDLHSWAVFRSDRSYPCFSGLARGECSYYEKAVEKIILDEQKRLNGEQV